MRAGAPDEVLSGAAGWACEVQSWRGGMFLADVPVLRGRAASRVDEQGNLSEYLTLTVPRWDGRDWLPGKDPLHPLARYGQELQVSIVVTSSVTGDEWPTRVGRYLITDWDESGDGSITVQGAGRLRRIADDKIPVPMQPRETGTFVSEARRLLPLGMSAGFDTALVDRPVPGGMVWSSDRLGALREIANAWPARLRTDEWGQVQFLAPLPDIPAPVLVLTDGDRGTLVSAPRSDTRNEAYNRVIARSSAPDAPDIQAVADLTSGPMAVDDENGVVSREWSSPLLTTPAMAAKAAATMLRSSVRTAQVIPVTCAPDPRVSIDDATDVVRDAGTGDESHTYGWVVGTDLPLTVDDGAMRVDVGVAE